MQQVVAQGGKEQLVTLDWTCFFLSELPWHRFNKALETFLCFVLT